MATTLEHSPSGWGVYVIAEGIIRQRYPGQYRSREEAERAAAEYQTWTHSQSQNRFHVLPWDAKIPSG